MSKETVLLKIITLQLIFCVSVFILLTALKFLNLKCFDELREVYQIYGKFDADASLVYEDE